VLVVFRFTDPESFRRAVVRLQDRGYRCREESAGGVVCRGRLNEIEDITYYLVLEGVGRGGQG
jgi:hypothetical protein